MLGSRALHSLIISYYDQMASGTPYVVRAGPNHCCYSLCLIRSIVTRECISLMGEIFLLHTPAPAGVSVVQYAYTVETPLAFFLMWTRYATLAPRTLGAEWIES